MTITRYNVFWLLVRRGLASRSLAVDHAIEIKENPGRNRSFAVSLEDGPGWFVKQEESARGGKNRYWERESACYRLGAEWGELGSMLPRLRDCSESARTLFLELASNENLFQRQRAMKRFLSACAGALGRGLGALRKRSLAETGRLAAESSFPRERPWILSPSWPKRQLRRDDLSRGQAAVAGLTQDYPEIGAALEQLRAGWEFTGLVHGDLKLENCLFPSEVAEAPGGVMIVDWECADVGDPRWDVGGLIQSYFNQWIHSLEPDRETASLEAAAATATWPIEDLRLVLRRLWEGYVEGASLSEAKRVESLRRCVQYSGARLLQTAFEWAGSRRRLSWRSVVQTQAALNLMTRPDDGVVELLGEERADA